FASRQHRGRQNMVATCDVGFPIRLEGIASKHMKVTSYEPELFPGLIYRMSEPKLVLLIFVSGKVVITGSKSLADVHEAYEVIYPHLVQEKKIATSLPAVPSPADAMAGAATAEAETE
ncbi:unnamed protein product, partial [Phaeothamnion confervicola]